MDATACTQRQLAQVLEELGMTSEAESFKTASPRDARRLANDVARRLDAPEHARLPHAFTAFALAVKHSEPGLEDIAQRNLRSARRFAGLED